MLTIFLLLKYGYDLDQYYSISYVILNSIDDYYRQLENSSIGWEDNKNDYEFFALYMLGCLRDGYQKLNYIIDVNCSYKFSYDKILKIINDLKVPMTKSNLKEILFTLSEITIEKNIKHFAGRKEN